MQIKINLGAVALEYEGPEDFFKSEIANIMKTLSAHAAVVPRDKFSGRSASEGSNGSASKGGGAVHSHSTNTVAKLLDAKSGPDLIMAAVVKKIMVDGDETINRPTITSEMRKASSYYKRTYANNLSKYLDNLTKADRLRLVSDNTFGLPAKVREEIEPRLSE